MYDGDPYLYRSYDRHVRLDDETQDRLAEYRTTNIARLKTGLGKLEKALPKRTCDQGSFAMDTMVQHPENDYDIDTGVIFDVSDLPSDPYARQDVLDGIKAGGGNFKKEPERRTNAVTVWYADGYHIDLAVYRRSTDAGKNLLSTRVQRGQNVIRQT
ncbi:MAG: hypothetical protein U0528_06075 [Anaerolineae bacterium]